MISEQLTSKLYNFFQSQQLLREKSFISEFHGSKRINYAGKIIICLQSTYNSLLDTKYKSYFS
jgi:hypothetical protein